VAFADASGMSGAGKEGARTWPGGPRPGSSWDEGGSGRYPWRVGWTTPRIVPERRDAGLPHRSVAGTGFGPRRLGLCEAAQGISQEDGGPRRPFKELSPGGPLSLREPRT
jgi:hypothetical protein